MRCPSCEPDYCACADFYAGRMQHWKGKLMTGSNPLCDLIAETATDLSAAKEVWTAGELADALVKTGRLAITDRGDMRQKVLHNERFQAACQQYAHNSGSSEAIAAAAVAVILGTAA